MLQSFSLNQHKLKYSSRVRLSSHFLTAAEKQKAEGISSEHMEGKLGPQLGEKHEICLQTWIKADVAAEDKTRQKGNKLK